MGVRVTSQAQRPVTKLFQFQKISLFIKNKTIHLIINRTNLKRIYVQGHHQNCLIDEQVNSMRMIYILILLSFGLGNSVCFEDVFHD